MVVPSVEQVLGEPVFGSSVLNLQLNKQSSSPISELITTFRFEIMSWISHSHFCCIPWGSSSWLF